MSSQTRLERAQLNADLARNQLASTLSEIQIRLSPRALIHDAADEAKSAVHSFVAETVTQARAHPLRAIGVVASVAALTTKSPVLRTIASLFLAPKETAASFSWFKR